MLSDDFALSFWKLPQQLPFVEPEHRTGEPEPDDIDRPNTAAATVDERTIEESHHERYLAAKSFFVASDFTTPRLSRSLGVIPNLLDN
jgi:hypothetical protein